jgi:hypothetical protein
MAALDPRLRTFAFVSVKSERNGPDADVGLADRLTKAAEE